MLRESAEKLLCDPAEARSVPKEVAEKYRLLIVDALRTAGWAPFHFPRNVDGLAEPWRAHVLLDREAHALAKHLQDEIGVTSKEPKLCAACSALVIVTWLPEFYRREDREASRLAEEVQRMRDEEHLAATSAMVQNFLLLLTELGLGTYWSSGGVLRTPEILKRIGAGGGERFLAGIFIEYPEMKNPGR